jgi:hypothetical protein
MIPFGSRRARRATEDPHTIAAVFEFRQADHAIPVVHDAPHIVVDMGSAGDLPDGVKLISLREAGRLVEEVESTRAGTALLFAITRCRKRVCDCADSGRRRLARKFADRVAAENDAAGWVRADVALPDMDAHYAHSLFDALAVDPGSVPERTEYRYDRATRTVQASHDDHTATWRPLDIHRVELRHTWKTAEDVTMALAWSPTVAQTVVQLWWAQAARNTDGVGASTPLTTFADLVAPLGQDVAQHECLRDLLLELPASVELTDMVQVVLAAGSDVPG